MDRTKWMVLMDTKIRRKYMHGLMDNFFYGWI